MIAYVKLAVLLIVLIGTMALTSGARTLAQDPYNNCYNGWQNWHNGGCRNSYWCNNYQWDCSGRYYDGRRWWNSGDRGGFCVGICFGK